MISPRTFNEGIRTTALSYPLPFMIGVLLLFALLCLAMSFGAHDGLRWLIAGTGVFGALAAFLTWGYALARRPELLRSERHQSSVGSDGKR